MSLKIPTSSNAIPCAKKSPYKLYIYLLCAPIVIPALYLFGTTNNFFSLQWRHNDRNDVSNYRHLDCLLNRLFRRISKKTPKLRVIGLCEGTSSCDINYNAMIMDTIRALFQFVTCRFCPHRPELFNCWLGLSCDYFNARKATLTNTGKLITWICIDYYHINKIKHNKSVCILCTRFCVLSCCGYSIRILWDIVVIASLLYGT